MYIKRGHCSLLWEKNVRSVALTSVLIVHWMAMLNIILAPLNCCFKIINKNKLCTRCSLFLLKRQILVAFFPETLNAILCTVLFLNFLTPI